MYGILQCRASKAFQKALRYYIALGARSSLGVAFKFMGDMVL